MTPKVDAKTNSPAAAQTERMVRKLRFGHLLLLEALHRCGTIQEAAQQLKLSRSAVSKSLGEIESAAGSALFERSRRGLRANAIGLIYLRGARRMLNDLEASVADASLARDPEAALLRVGAPPFLAATLLPAVVKRVLTTLPGLQLRLLQAPFAQLAQALHDASLDCLLTSLTSEMVQPDSKRGLHIEPLYMGHNRVLAPRTAPWTRRHSWRIEELAAARWVMLPRGMGLRQSLENAFLQAGCIPPEPVVETSGVFSHAALAEAVNALVLLQEPLATIALKAGRMVSLNVEPVPGLGPITLVTRKGGRPSPAVDALRTAVRSVASSLYPGATLIAAGTK